MKINLNDYDAFIFDCDGVLLDSNHIKNNAFFDVVKVYGEENAYEFLEYHKLNGGISRYVKFEYFCNKFLKKDKFSIEYEEMLQNYANIVFEKLLRCRQASGIDWLKHEYPDASWAVASGSDELELNEILQMRNLKHFFEMGVHGSPKSKFEILYDIKCHYSINKGILFGDSKLDYDVAMKHDLDFIFVSGWADSPAREYFENQKNLMTVQYISDLK